MAIHIQNLDLEEQEQLAALKHFWSRWGGLITGLLIIALGALAVWNGWNYWQRHQAAQASGLYAQLEQAAASGDAARVKRAWADLQSQYGKTAYAAQGGLLAAKTLNGLGEGADARSALSWVAEQGPGDANQALARLRLASLQMGDKAYDEALKTLSAPMPDAFAPLAADRRGDVLLLQGQREQAAAEYRKAYQGLGRGDLSGYESLIGFKLNALGVDPAALAAPAAAAASEGARS